MVARAGNSQRRRMPNDAPAVGMRPCSMGATVGHRHWGWIKGQLLPLVQDTDGTAPPALIVCNLATNFWRIDWWQRHRGFGKGSGPELGTSLPKLSDDWTAFSYYPG